MKATFSRRAAALALTLACAASPASATDRHGPLGELSARWWQWALSIPVAQNPISDTTGASCVIGQRGNVWFLAGTSGSTARRTCTVPARVPIFFPVINSVWFNTPNLCGSGPATQFAPELRSLAAPFIDGASKLSVKLDGRRVWSIQRVKSKVFVLALPESNFFSEPCRDYGGFPGGVYSPAVDDGYYVLLPGLSPGMHTLEIRGENESAKFMVEVNYRLNVVPTILK